MWCTTSGEHVLVGRRPRTARARSGTSAVTSKPVDASVANARSRQPILGHRRPGSDRVPPRGRHDHLVRARRRPRDNGAQRLVPFEDVGDRAAQRGRCRVAGQPHRDTACCTRSTRVEPVRGTTSAAAASDSGIRSGRGRGPPARAGRSRRSCDSARAASAGHRRRLEQRPDRHAVPSAAPMPGHHLGRDQRVAAEVEEVVVEPDPRRTPEHLGERPRRRSPRSGVAGARYSGCADAKIRRRQRLAVQLAARRSAATRRAPPRRRHHVRRQLLARRTSRSRGRRPIVAPGGHDVGDQTAHRCASSARPSTDGLADRRVPPAAPPRSHRARSADRASSPGSRCDRCTPARPPRSSAPGPGPVHPLTGRAERVGHEPLRGQIRPAQ